MAKKAYNYTLAETHKGKVYIPYLGLEIDSWSTFFMAIIGFITITLSIGFPLSLLVGSNGYFLGIVVGTVSVVIVVSLSNEVNNETGRTKIKEFYYTNIKGYRFVYDPKGNKHYLKRKEKGVIYVACR